MFNLNASEEQLNFQTIYGSSKQGWMSTDWRKPTNNINVLLDTIINHIPKAPIREGITQMQITSLDYSSFKGRIAIGRVFQGKSSPIRPENHSAVVRAHPIKRCLARK